MLEHHFRLKFLLSTLHMQKLHKVNIHYVLIHVWDPPCIYLLPL